MPRREADGGGSAPELLEVKTITFCPKWYHSVADPAKAKPAVELRAGAVPGEYAAALHRKDRAWCGTAAGEVGPMEAVLKSHPPLRAMVFGAVGEAGKAVHAFVSTLARVSAEEAARRMGMRTEGAAAGCMAWFFRRRIATAHWRALANLLHGRVAFLDDFQPETRRGHGRPQRHGSAATRGARRATDTCRAARDAMHRQGAAMSGAAAASAQGRSGQA